MSALSYWLLFGLGEGFLEAPGALRALQHGPSRVSRPLQPTTTRRQALTNAKRMNLIARCAPDNHINTLNCAHEYSTFCTHALPAGSCKR